MAVVGSSAVTCFYVQRQFHWCCHHVGMLLRCARETPHKDDHLPEEWSISPLTGRIPFWLLGFFFSHADNKPTVLGGKL